MIVRWDFDIPSKNMIDFMEQDALWVILTSPDAHFALNKSSVALLKEPQFPSNWHGLNDLWTVHLPNYVPNRMAYFRYL
jgi:hypothetical protein